MESGCQGYILERQAVSEERVTRQAFDLQGPRRMGVFAGVPVVAAVLTMASVLSEIMRKYVCTCFLTEAIGRRGIDGTTRMPTDIDPASTQPVLVGAMCRSLARFAWKRQEAESTSIFDHEVIPWLVSPAPNAICEAHV